MVRQHEKSFRAAVRRGVPIALGNRCRHTFNYHGDNAQELERMVTLGMTPMDAIMTSTSAAAHCCDFRQKSAPLKPANRQIYYWWWKAIR